MYGWMGKIIRANLADETIDTEPLNMRDVRLYLGGRGLGARIHVNEVGPTADALSPENKLIFMTGPLTGTLAACEGRYQVVAKVPLTGTVGACGTGGHFGSELKYAGYDGIIFEGKAERPTYLYINDDHIELRDASQLWGRDVFATTDELEKETDEDIRIACIGPDGEKMTLLAAIMDGQSLETGRSELGAVMGSKNLKAVAVRGTHSIEVAKKREFLDACIAARACMKDNSAAVSGSHAYVKAVMESAGICPFNASALGVHEIAEMVRTCTGLEYTDGDLLALGERVMELEQYSS